jgi:hypothetical protein
MSEARLHDDFRTSESGYVCNSGRLPNARRNESNRAAARRAAHIDPGGRRRQSVRQDDFETLGAQICMTS